MCFHSLPNLAVAWQVSSSLACFEAVQSAEVDEFFHSYNISFIVDLSVGLLTAYLDLECVKGSCLVGMACYRRWQDLPDGHQTPCILGWVDVHG